MAPSPRRVIFGRGRKSDSISHRGNLIDLRLIPPTISPRKEMFSSPGFPSQASTDDSSRSSMTTTMKINAKRKPISRKSVSSPPVLRTVSPIARVSIGSKDLFGHDERRDDADDELASLRMANDEKDEQLRVLNDRILRVQEGLESIDEERSRLLNKSRAVEQEKKRVQRQLQLRDREIAALTKRFASQEEKVKESTILRSQNRLLESQLAELQTKSADVGQADTTTRRDLEAKLNETEENRQKLTRELTKLQSEHTSVVESLNECREKIDCLEKEKEQLDEERKRERKRMDLELEKQRAVHAAASDSLKKDMESQKDRINQLERIMRDSGTTKMMLRKDNATLVKSHQEELKKVTEQFEKEIRSLRDTLDSPTKSCTKELEESLLAIKKELDDKDEVLLELEFEFSEQMETLMEKTTALDQARIENAALEDRVKFLKSIEHEHSALIDFVQIVDSNLADVTAENAHLTVENDDLFDKVAELQSLVEKLEEKIDRVNLNRRAREADFRALLEAEQDELRLELEQRVASTVEEGQKLVTDIESQNRSILLLKEELASAQSAVTEKEKNIHQVHLEKDEIKRSYEKALSEAHSIVESLRKDVSQRDETISSLEEEVKSLKALVSARNEQMSRIANERESDKQTIIDLQTELADANEHSQQLIRQLAESKNEHSKLTAELEEERKHSSIINDQLEQGGELRAEETKALQEAQSKHQQDQEALLEKIKTSEKLRLSLEQQTLSLQFSIEQTEKRLEQAADEHETAKQEIICLRGEVVHLKQELTAREEKITSMESKFKSSIQSKYEASAKEIKAATEKASREANNFQALLKSTKSEIVTLEERLRLREKRVEYLLNELESCERSSAEKDLAIQSIREELDGLRAADYFSSEGSDREYKMQLFDREERISRLNDEILSLSQKLDEATADATTQSEAHMARISVLEAAVSSKDSIIDELQKRLLSLESQLDSRKESDVEKDKAITQLEEDLDRAKTNDDADGLRKEIVHLKTELALKDDEIRDLRLIEMKDLEESNKELQDQIATLTRESDGRGGDASIELETLERMAEETKCQYASSVEVLKGRIDRQEADIRRKELQLSDQDSMLKSRDTEILSLTSQLAEARASAEDARSERDQLVEAGEASKENLGRLGETFQKSFARSMEDDVTDAQHEEEPQDDNTPLQKQQTETAAIEKLQDDSDHFKRLSSELENERGRLTEYEQKVNESNAKLGEKTIELVNARQDLKDQTEALMKERAMREDAEGDLQQLAAENEKSARRVAELEKECASLKEKIRRQEVRILLNRKKAKALRDHNTGKGIVPGGSGSMSLPSRSKIPRASRSVCSLSESSSKQGSKAQSQPICRSGPASEIPDWELEN